MRWGPLSAVRNGVLQDDTDADNDSLTVTLSSAPAHGSLILNTNGSFTYTPDEAFSGSDSFSYRDRLQTVLKTRVQAHRIDAMKRQDRQEFHLLV